MDRYKEKVDEYKEENIYNYADRFINLANEMAQSDNSGAVGVAFRYAAARYCAYEASIQTDNLAEDSDRQLQLFVDAFTEMLRINIEEYINIQAQNKNG